MLWVLGENQMLVRVCYGENKRGRTHVQKDMKNITKQLFSLYSFTDLLPHLLFSNSLLFFFFFTLLFSPYNFLLLSQYFPILREATDNMPHLNISSFILNMQVFTWNTDAWGYGPGTTSLYQSHPWVLAVTANGEALGVLADTTLRCEVM